MYVYVSLGDGFTRGILFTAKVQGSGGLGQFVANLHLSCLQQDVLQLVDECKKNQARDQLSTDIAMTWR